MLDLYAELQRVVDAFESDAIPYALIGGLAVSIYTVPRATEDIDIFLKREDFDRAAHALTPLGFRRAGRPMRLANGRLEMQRLTKIEGTDLLPVDLLAPLDAALTTLLDDRTAVTVEHHRVWVAGVRALRALKRLRDSALDRADLEALGPEDS